MASTGPNIEELSREGREANIEIDNTEGDIDLVRQYIARNTANLEELRMRVNELQRELQSARDDLNNAVNGQRRLLEDTRNTENVASDMEELSRRRSNALERMGTINGELRRIREDIGMLETRIEGDTDHVADLGRELITGDFRGGKRKSKNT